MIAADINRQGVQPLWALNGWDNPATIKPGELRDVNLGELGDLLQKAANAGMDWGFLNPEDTITDEVRAMAGFEPRPMDEGVVKLAGRPMRWDKRRKMYVAQS